MAVGTHRIAHKIIMYFRYRLMAIFAFLGTNFPRMHLVNRPVMTFCAFWYSYVKFITMAIDAFHGFFGMNNMWRISMAFLAIDIAGS
jgi:hypothetical protein